MSTFIIGFGLGFAASAAWAWFAAHPEERKALLDKAKALFRKKDAP